MAMAETPRTDNQDVLAVIPTFNEEAHIEACIRSLMAPETADVKLVVCDGMSTDRTCEIVHGLQSEFPNLYLLENPKRLQSAAINLAADRMATPASKYLVRCDAHSIYPERFITRIAETLQNTGAASVVTAMDAVGTDCFEKANAWIVDTPLGSGGSAHRGGTVSQYIDHGHHAGFDLSWFRKVGGYDESFSHNEDAEYDHRLAQLGGQIYLDADIRIQYVPRSNLKALAKQYFNYGKGRARTLKKHRMQPKLRQMLPVFALLGCVSGFALSPIFPVFALIPVTYLAIILAAALVLTIAKRSLCALWAAPALAAMHMSWGLGFLMQLFRPAPAGTVTKDCNPLAPNELMVGEK